ncbi:hypothetical protein SAMD00019534_124000 [Acytostelium subglobosum LB1]|uniref:hypothetical protein n=1 Tax=Acytostelium subglobosum LB1 TaxID=1410327 RepID=UPI000644DC9F|nr:hypothetical protein SAMD00019534_124000 [Acytostelium subglobosum LB1]GAM29224.1 hypothetical protein SAMD00019534_124000 [Acytostelium subglobosum LB1]|eukprot:XP_012747798.1 hypothetical protein SAMD00019534_124000 [Acytostelium subglobosum LB1]
MLEEDKHDIFILLLNDLMSAVGDIRLSLDMIDTLCDHIPDESMTQHICYQMAFDALSQHTDIKTYQRVLDSYPTHAHGVVISLLRLQNGAAHEPLFARRQPTMVASPDIRSLITYYQTQHGIKYEQLDLLMCAALKHERYDIFKIVHDKLAKEKPRALKDCEEYHRHMAAYANTDILTHTKYSISTKAPKYYKHLNTAAGKGNLAILKLVRQELATDSFPTGNTIFGDSYMLDGALRGGYIECARYILDEWGDAIQSKHKRWVRSNHSTDKWPVNSLAIDEHTLEVMDMLLARDQDVLCGFSDLYIDAIKANRSDIVERIEQLWNEAGGEPSSSISPPFITLFDHQLALNTAIQFNRATFIPAILARRPVGSTFEVNLDNLGRASIDVQQVLMCHAQPGMIMMVNMVNNVSLYLLELITGYGHFARQPTMTRFCLFMHATNLPDAYPLLASMYVLCRDTIAQHRCIDRICRDSGNIKSIMFLQENRSHGSVEEWLFQALAAGNLETVDYLLSGTLNTNRSSTITSGHFLPRDIRDFFRIHSLETIARLRPGVIPFIWSRLDEHKRTERDYIKDILCSDGSKACASPQIYQVIVDAFDPDKTCVKQQQIVQILLQHGWLLPSLLLQDRNNNDITKE